MRVLVLGGSGFLGRHVAAALRERGHRVVIGSRHRAPGRRSGNAQETAWRIVRFEKMSSPRQWDDAVGDVDAVANCVGILRERGDASYDCVHHLAPAALALACARGTPRRLVHVSALGLRDGARSRFIRSKMLGELALRAGGSACTIVRPSLLDGNGGFGARWIRACARLPIHVVPADAAGRIAALDVRDAGEAIAILCEDAAALGPREVELGGGAARTLREHLAALRRVHSATPACCLRMPALLARLASHACDLLRLSPFSFGHLELLRHDNRPAVNLLPALLGRPPRPVGAPHYSTSFPTSVPTLPPAPAIPYGARHQWSDGE